MRRADGKTAQFILARPYTVDFKLDGERRTITVPQGMLTDLSSVPALARPIISQAGPHLEASIVHDFLYIAWQDLGGGEHRTEDRRFADRLMRVAMRAANVGSLKNFLIYNAVRIGGRGIYRGREPEPRYVVVP